MRESYPRSAPAAMICSEHARLIAEYRERGYRFTTVSGGLGLAPTLMYLVVIQSLVSAVSGIRLPWHELERTGMDTALTPELAGARR